MGMICSANNATPAAEDAHSAYFAAADKLGLKITRFEKISGQWELENILYKMDIAVEGIKDKAVYKHIEVIRFHKTNNGWYVELPVFRICGIRKSDLKFNPIGL